MKKEVKYVVVDIGCIECGESSNVVGIFDTIEQAEEAINQYITNEPDEIGFNWGRKEWHGQHSVEIFEVAV